MLKLIVRRVAARNAGIGTDNVVVGLSMPGGTAVTDIRIKMGVEAIAKQAMNKVVAYAVEGWVLPVHDPDAGASFTSLIDALVPKDTDVQVLDLDTAAADATPFFEPGEAEWGQLFDVGLKPRRIYHRHKFLNFAMSPVGYNLLPSSDVPEWWPVDSFNIHIKRTIRVKNPSILVFALASPAMDDKSATGESALAEAEWAQVKYTGHVLERAMLHLLGLTETGAETPWEEATALLQKHMQPDM